jgi:hypothetical protein
MCIFTLTVLHGKRMRRSALSSVAYPAVQYFSMIKQIPIHPKVCVDLFLRTLVRNISHSKTI